MKKTLLSLLLVVSSVLSFGAQRVPYEKLTFPDGYIYYNNEKYTGEFERKSPRTGKINLIASVKEGPSKTYYESGVLSADLNYKNDKFEGMQKYYHENGKLQAEIPTRKGVIDGVSKLYDENGKLQEEILFKNGQKVK